MSIVYIYRNRRGFRQTNYNLDCKKGPGPDDLSAYFSKYCAFALSRPLWLLLNKSLSEGLFPTIWKRSYIVPIYKKAGDKGMVINYRPITRISHIPKIFESLVTDYLTFKLKNYILVSNMDSFKADL